MWRTFDACWARDFSLPQTSSRVTVSAVECRPHSSVRIARTVRFAGVVAVAVLLVAACSNDASPPTASQPTASTASSSDSTEPLAVGGAPSPSAGDPETSAPAAPSTTALPMPTFDDADLPDPPLAVSVDLADPAAAALQLVAATDDGLDDTGPGWLGVYAAIGIPVRDDPGVTPAADDDPLGPRWDQVWALGVLARGTASVDLNDVGVAIGAGDPIDGSVLLDDLRAAAAGDPVEQVLARFVQGKSLAAGGADPLEPATTADQVLVDAATGYLITWAAYRQALVDWVGTGPLPDDLVPPPAVTASAAGIGFGGGAASRPHRLAGTRCSDFVKDEETTSWVNWIANKVGGGGGIGGVGSFDSVAERLGGLFGRKSGTTEAFKKAFGAAASRLNVAASAFSLYAQINSILVTTVMDPEPLTRKKSRDQGENATIRVSLSFEASTLNANSAAKCLLATAANAIGIGLSLPEDGKPLAGVELQVDAGENIPEKVLINEGTMRFTTNAEGTTNIRVVGATRAKAVGERAQPYDDEFGLRYAAQVEPISEQSILNVFIGGLTGGPAGALVDILKTAHHDLGEYVYRLVDWFPTYRVDGFFGGYRVTGEICTPSGFTLDVDGSGALAIVGPFTFLGDGTNYTYTFGGVVSGGLPTTGRGDAILIEALDPPQLHILPGIYEYTVPVLGTQTIQFSGTIMIDLIADDTVCR
jgi:hypothetical protein